MYNVAYVIAMFILLAIVLGAVLALPVMWLWNSCLVDAVSGVRNITFLQAWGLMILSSLMFNSSSRSK